MGGSQQLSKFFVLAIVGVVVGVSGNNAERTSTTKIVELAHVPHVVEDDPRPISSMIPEVDPILTSGYFQGDMMMTERQIAERFGNAAAFEASQNGETVELNSTREQRLLGIASGAAHIIWPNNTLYYQFDPDYPSELADRVREVLTDFAALTHVKAVESTGSGNYVVVTLGGGCSSYIGMVRGPQAMQLARGCMSRGTILHEFMHALGFYHEHGAIDRDNFITVNVENVLPGQEGNFNLVLGPYGVPNSYDLASVMHYPEYGFSKNGLKTIDCRGNPCGQREGLSVKDVLDIRALYPEITPMPTAYTPTEKPTTSYPTHQPTFLPSSQPTQLWTCSSGRYNRSDGCNCACGTVDPDCSKPRVSDNAKLFCGNMLSDETKLFCSSSNFCSPFVETSTDPTLDIDTLLIAAGSCVAVSVAAVLAVLYVRRQRRGATPNRFIVRKTDDKSIDPMTTLSPTTAGTEPYSTETATSETV